MSSPLSLNASQSCGCQTDPKAEQGDADDFVHLTLPCVRDVSFDYIKPRLRACRGSTINDLESIDAQLDSMLANARPTLINETAKRCVLSLGA